MNKEITVVQVNVNAREMANRIKYLFPDKQGKIAVYGVPRGGIPAAFAIAAQSSNLITVVGDARDADIIIDDLTDSGKTMARYSAKYPNKPFITLFGKPSEWLIFPWEKGETDTSADDIPTRLLEYLGEDSTRGGLKETPKRFLKAWKHYTSGYDKEPKDVLKVFEDGAEKCDEMILVKDIPVFSHCEHHLAPFYGKAHIAYIPDGKILGLSKLVRVVDIFMRRLQVQERLTNQIAEAINSELAPVGIGIVIECEHTCMIGRGVQVQGSTTITSAMRGAFKDNPETRAEFMSLIK